MRRWVPLLAVLLSVLPAVAHGDTSAEPERLLGPRPLCCTNGMALAEGKLVVNHAALDAISIVDPDTGDFTRLADEEDDPHDEIVTPDDVWVDPDSGDLYVTEILANGVRRISPDGTRTRVMAGFGDGVAHPNAITGLRRPGEPLRLFISMVSFEPGSRTGIWEVDPDGLLPPRLVYGAAGGLDVYGTGMRAPNAFAFDPSGAELFVPESYGGRVWAVDVDAHTARLVYDPSDGTHPRPNGIALRFAADGSILYAEQDTGRLLRLDPAGPPEQAPTVVAQLDPGIDGIVEHPDGRIFLSNFRFGGISVVHTDGVVRQLVPRALNLPSSLSILGDGRVAVGDLGSLAVVDPTDASIDRPKQFIRDDFDIAVGVGAAGDCDVYATGFFRGTLQHVDVCKPGQPHTEIVPRRTFATPWDVAVGSGALAGQLWVADAAGTVWRLTGVDGGQAATPLPLPGAFANPLGVDVDHVRGRLYVSENAAGQVRVVDPVTGVPLGAVSGLDEPEGVAVDPCDGSIYVVEAGAGRLTHVRPDGARTTVMKGLATDIRGVSVVPVLNYAAGVAVDEVGTVYVSAPEDGSLWRIPAPEGVRVCQVPLPGPPL